MSNEKTGRRGKKRIWGKDDTELSLLALPTTIWYLPGAATTSANWRKLFSAWEPW